MATQAQAGPDLASGSPPWSLNAAAVDKWLDEAKPHDELVYARGGHRPLMSDGVRALQQAYDEGRVTFKQRRHGAFDYSFIAERLADPRRPAPALRIARPVRGPDDDEIADLMSALRRRANRSAPMGTNRELGEEIGAGVGPDRVAYLLRKQISAGRIRVEAVGIGCRVCTIVATGKKTAPFPACAGTGSGSGQGPC